MRSIVNRPQDSSGTQEHNSDEHDSQLADMQWSGILVYDVQYAQLEDLCCWNMALHQKNNQTISVIDLTKKYNTGRFW